MECSFSIYYLADPRDRICRYVGLTKNTTSRTRQHIKEARIRKKITHKNNWIYRLLCDGVQPELSVLETGLSFAEACDLERSYISYFRYIGFELVNATDGGDGPAGVLRTPEQREHLKHLNTGKKHTAEAKAKMSIARRGRKLSEDHKKAIGVAQVGKKRPHTEEAKQKISANHARLSRPQTPETRAKISASLRARYQSGPDAELVKKLWNAP